MLAVVQIFHQRLGDDKVRLPGLASVRRESLLKVAGIGLDVEYTESHQNGSAIVGFLVHEIRTFVLERTNDRRTERAASRVGKMDTPFVRVGVVKTQRKKLEVTARTVRQDVRHIGAVPDLPNHIGPVVLNPVRGPSERMNKPSLVRLPCADVPIEVMPAISRLRRNVVPDASRFA